MRPTPLLPCLALLLALAACGPDAPQPTPATDTLRTATRPPPAVPLGTDSLPAPPTPFDAAAVVFDTTEPPEQVVRFPPRPAPAPRPPTPRPPTPTPAPPPPRPSGSAGSCDVRPEEGYCSTYTGAEWTREAAQAQCAAAPDAVFAAATCPSEGRIATCVYERPSAPGREITYTYYAPYDPMLAELACPGTFTRIE